MAGKKNCENITNGISVKYIPQVGKTEVTLNGCRADVDEALLKLVDNHSHSLTYCNWYDIHELNNSYRAFSKVNDMNKENFDPEVGKKLAYEKVMRKYHKQYDTKMRDFLLELRGLEAAVEHHMDKKDVDYSSVASVRDIKNKRFSGIK